MNDANYVIVTRISSDVDKLVKKFTDLISNVLDTEVPSSDVKQLDLNAKLADAADNDDSGSSEETEASLDIVLLIKLTTK